MNFLKSIGYLINEDNNFNIETDRVDNEISSVAGPQLVVPVDNSRYALNAANARWGSLYNALYGTDVISGKIGKSWDKERAQKVINYVRIFLDESFPLQKMSWKEITKIEVDATKLVLFSETNKDYLKNDNQFIGFNGDQNNPTSILIKNNNLHLDILIDPNSLVGKIDKANISDVISESALSTIIDNEDSVAAVDAEDKVKCYRNWLGLMKGDLTSIFEKNGKKIVRKLNPDRNYTSKDGKKITLHGRALLLNRNVGHLMTNPSILLKDGSEIPEGIMDAFVSTMCALHDFKNKKNSRTGSVYIVKPKMHGPDEVAFTNTLFGKVEEALEIEKYCIKVGIMDEERRTTINLKECIRQVKNRIVFINTGFLDRTGDEMHTSFEAGPMIFKGDMKKSKWLNAYENWNVDIGLSCGFSGKAQIGKGMWVIDSANIYKGHFHILGGTLNASENYEQKNLLIESLIKRIKKNNLKEVIIATSATVEGQTTAHYIEDTIKNDKIKITKLAQGLPIGGEIEQLDDGTLFSAFKNRVPVTES